MAEIRYSHQSRITLTGKEDVITGYSPNYVVVCNDTGDTVYISKEGNISQKQGTSVVKTIPAGMAGYIAVEKGVNDRFFAVGKGDIAIAEADTVKECLTIITEMLIGRLCESYIGTNLLTNPDFAVNQRGLASYSSSGDTVDRWKTGGAKLTVDDGFITLENTTAKAAATIYQVVENPTALSGKTVALSFDYDLKTEGAWISVQAVANGSWNPSAPVQLTNTGRNVKSTVITLPENLTDLRLALVIHSTDSAPFAIADIYGAKLEFGKIATPIIPADPATELAKCQRYYQIRSTGDIPAVDLRPSMRATPTVTQLSDGNFEYSSDL